MPARKPIAELIEELKSWLPNYDHGPEDYPTLLWRILASAPGGDRAEDMGYEPFQLGWHEIDQLGRVLVAIQDKRDVEDLINGLIGEEEEEVDESKRPRRPMREAAHSSAPWVPPALAAEGITPVMLDVVLNGVGDHARIRPGQSVVYDRDGYGPLRQGGYIVLKRATPGLSSFGDYYVLTDKGADLMRRWRLESRRAANPPPREARRRPRRRRS